MIKGLLKRAKRAAEQRLPAELMDAGRRVRAEVEQRIETALSGGTTDAPPTREQNVSDQIRRARDRMTDEEPAQVIIYSTDDEREDVQAMRSLFAAKGEPVRMMNLDDTRTRRNIMGSTGVMVPPYVYIDGRFWGARFDIEALEEEGDLDKILAGDLDTISEVGRKIGKVHESFSDAMTVENILDRLGRGHSLCVDDIDTWLEDDGGEHILFHQGGRLTGASVQETIKTLASRIEAGDIEAFWRLEPEIKMG
ncbi:MAG: hypothetical protein GY946_30080 [bacterium]|nr:hypothetical protein [bacterium]